MTSPALPLLLTGSKMATTTSSSSTPFPSSSSVGDNSVSPCSAPEAGKGPAGMMSTGGAVSSSAGGRGMGMQEEEEEEVEMMRLPSTEVEKHLELEFDLGNLLAVDSNDTDIKLYRQGPEAYLISLARDNTQLLLNKLFSLPREQDDDVVVVKLPAPTTRLPREKPLPQPKKPTRWEVYAKAKGIQKKGRKTREKLSWDEAVSRWVPAYGYRKAQAEKEKEWVIEVPRDSDPNEDQFSKRKADKGERVAKNELQRLRNLARAKKTTLPGLGVMPTEKKGAQQLGEAATLAKRATASMGKFQETLPKEKKAKGAVGGGSGKKRKFDPVVMDREAEKSKNMGILDRIIAKRPKLDIDKAVNRQMFSEQTERSSEKREGGRKKKKGGKGGAKKRAMEGKKRYAAKRGAQKKQGGAGKKGKGKR